MDKLENYLVLVLANQESLSKEKTAMIKEFVKNGGGLVATGNTGMFDEWRRLRKKIFLEEMLSETDSGKKAMAVSPGEMGTQIIPVAEETINSL